MTYKLTELLSELDSIDFIKDLAVEAIEELESLTGENYSETLEDLEYMTKEEIIEMFIESGFNLETEIDDIETFKNKLHIADIVFSAFEE